MLSGQTLLITPSITCSFAATYNLNFPRPAPIWPCSSVGRALVICSGGREFESQRGQRFFLFDRVGPNFLSGAIAQKVEFGIFIGAVALSGQTLLVTPSL